MDDRYTIRDEINVEGIGGELAAQFPLEGGIAVCADVYAAIWPMVKLLVELRRLRLLRDEEAGDSDEPK